MARRKLELESIDVTSFTVSPAPALQPGEDIDMLMAGGGDCCTGCVSGCGYNPTAGGCESDGGSQYCDTTVPMYAYCQAL